jgi:hypothetical protein
MCRAELGHAKLRQSPTRRVPIYHTHFICHTCPICRIFTDRIVTDRINTNMV